MSPEDLKLRNFEKEFIFSASRSSGPGGQNVNKVSSRIELRINITESRIFTESEKIIILTSLFRKINKLGELIIVAQTKRSQFLNRNLAEERFYRLIAKALTPVQSRKDTKPTVVSVRKRLESKRITGLKKQLRNFDGNKEFD